MTRRDRPIVDREIAHQPLDDDAADAVVLGERKSALRRELPALDRARIAGDVRHVEVQHGAARAALARAARGPYHDELAELADQCVSRAF